MSTDLKVFMVFAMLVLVGITVAGFLVFVNFLNREEERGRRFRARRLKRLGEAPPDGGTEDPPPPGG